MLNSPINLSALGNITSLPVGAIVFAIILSVFWVHSFFVQYHLIRFGIGVFPKNFALFTMIGSLVISIIAAFAFFNLHT